MIRLYFSGIPPFGKRHRALIQTVNKYCHYRLFSMHGPYQKITMGWVQTTKENGPPYPRTIMLDSGAFTAWNKGDEVNLDDVTAAYDRFLEETDGLLDNVWMINLDKIPGRAGVDPTREEIDEALRISDQNLDFLQRRFGDRVLPVFHQGESEARLDVVRQQAQYVCLSPRNDLREGLRYKWAYDMHARHPGIMSHGLAATGNEMMANVPWYSVDSAVWVFAAVYGAIIMKLEGAKFMRVGFSVIGSLHREWDIHFDTMPEIQQARIEARINQYGFSLDEIRHIPAVRCVISLAELAAYAEVVSHPDKLFIQERIDA